MAGSLSGLGADPGTDEPLLFDGNTLTAHGVIVGMTGSGKTGLGFAIIEEALINGISTLVLDPKGDMGNLLLNFPDFERYRSGRARHPVFTPRGETTRPPRSSHT